MLWYARFHSRTFLSASALLLAGLGCNTSSGRGGFSKRSDDRAVFKATSSAELAAVGEGSEVLSRPYPAGRWRLASLEELSRVVLWASHILIRHAEVPSGQVSFELADWSPMPPPPSRTRRAAFELAERLAEQVASTPSDFAVVAHQVSEDEVTRGQGGSLGGICAMQLYRRHAPVLDALSAIRPGEPSRVVETIYGFHIFMRHFPPPETLLSGTRIVIAYDDAPWLGAFLARRPLPSRSRQQALDFAGSLYARARSGEGFEALVESYSEHEEALRRGDFGEWSTHRCTPYPREVEALSQLAVGEISRPMDSAFGIEILRRDPNRTRPLYAMTTIEQRFDRAQMDGSPSAPRAVLENIERIAREVAGDPLRFDQFQKNYCCADVQQWQQGQGSAPAERALDLLGPGQIALLPIQLAGAYALAKRLVPTPKTPPSSLFELPSPYRPDVDYLVRTGMVGSQLSALARRGCEALGLKGAIAERFVVLHDAAQAAVEAEPVEARVYRFAEFQSQVEALLGSVYLNYRSFLEAYFEEQLLNPPVPRDLRNVARQPRSTVQ